MLSSYHRECGIQTLPFPVRTETSEPVGLLGSAPWALRNKPLGDPKGYLKPTLGLLGDTNMPIAVGQTTGLWVVMLVPRRE